MSNNSTHNNDENLLEIKGDTALARTYLAEFMRLYEHYRARALWQKYQHAPGDTLKLKLDAAWAGNAFTQGTPEYRARRAMVGEGA
jgi:phosphatidylserine/phosphatidylglycerophosphate/cardiolipin synthase-like enzyme